MILEKRLRSAEHLAFFSSLFLSRLADQILPFPVPLVVFQTTHSAAWSDLEFFVETLPRLLSLAKRAQPLEKVKRKDFPSEGSARSSNAR
jgi:hypothetical protein